MGSKAFQRFSARGNFLVNILVLVLLLMGVAWVPVFAAVCEQSTVFPSSSSALLSSLSSPHEPVGLRTYWLQRNADFGLRFFLN